VNSKYCSLKRYSVPYLSFILSFMHSAPSSSVPVFAAWSTASSHPALYKYTHEHTYTHKYKGDKLPVWVVYCAYRRNMSPWENYGSCYLYIFKCFSHRLHIKGREFGYHLNSKYGGRKQPFSVETNFHTTIIAMSTATYTYCNL